MRTERHAGRPRRGSPLRLLWVNDAAALIGGCERYVQDTARLLRVRGVHSTLLYDIAGRVDPAYLRAFDAAFPVVDPALQLEALAPDVVYVHRLGRSELLAALTGTASPVLRFFHDYELFCPREHKYTAVGLRTCERPVGPHCYTCLGFVRRATGWPGIRLSRVGRLRNLHDRNRALDGFVVGSSYMAMHLAAHGFAGDRTHVLPLYAAPPCSSGQVRRTPDRLLFAGQLVRGKGLDVLLRAMGRMRHRATLIVAGTGTQEAELQRRARRLGLSGRVSFEGRLSRAELDAQYRTAAAVVVPSRSPETFGLVGPEAMACATPVVATAAGGTGEWLDDGVNGFAVSPGDVAGLARALDRIVGRPRLARVLGRNARKAYLERFTPERHVEDLLELLQRFARREVAA